jgi:predicted small lipoprotein YifL
MVVGLLLTLSAIGCGRKGPPKPLKPRAPVAWSAQTWGMVASTDDRLCASGNIVVRRTWH